MYCLPGWIDAEIGKMLAAGDLKQAVNCGAPSCGYRVHVDGKANSGIYNCWHNVTDEDFVVWMRVAALPSFKKLYRKIPKGALKKDTAYVLEVHDRFPVAGFKGGKHFVLSTTSWIGGKNRCAMHALVVCPVVFFSRCDALVRRCDALVRQCDALVRQCDALVRQCGALVRRCDALVRQCDALVRQCDALVRQCDALVRQFDALVRQCDALVRRCCCVVTWIGGTLYTPTHSFLYAHTHTLYTPTHSFLGYAYVVVGAICVALALAFLAKQLISPRKMGDPRYLNLQ